MSDNNSVLDDLLADPAPAGDAGQTTETAATESPPAPEPQNSEQPRGPDGKFAPKASEPAPTEQQPETPAAEPAATPSADGKTVPLAAHIAQREELNGKLDEAMRQIQQLQGQIQMLSQRPAQPAEPKEQQKPKEFWEDPDGFAAEKVKAEISPVQQQVQRLTVTYSHRAAVQEFGAEAVQAATNALKAAVASGALDGQATQQRLGASLDPIGDIVRWHREQENRRLVGDDPNKWLEAELEKRLNDPAIQAKIIERIRGSQPAAPSSGQAAPVVLPPSLNRIPGGANSASPADTSSEALFQQATAGM